MLAMAMTTTTMARAVMDIRTLLSFTVIVSCGFNQVPCGRMQSSDAPGQSPISFSFGAHKFFLWERGQRRSGRCGAVQSLCGLGH